MKLENVKWLYATDWYDYVLSGVVLYEDKKYYAFLNEENENYEEDGWWRKYLVVDPSQEFWEK